MSMTQVAFVNENELPTKLELETCIRKLGYDFVILDDFENIFGIEGMECSLNGHKTFFEIYFDDSSEIANDFDFIKRDLSNQDTVMSFIWGADFAAGAAIGLISVALIDKCKALIYYLDGEMAYSREMLLADIPAFLNELN